MTRIIQEQRVAEVTVPENVSLLALKENEKFMLDDELEIVLYKSKHSYICFGFVLYYEVFIWWLS